MCSFPDVQSHQPPHPSTAFPIDPVLLSEDSAHLASTHSNSSLPEVASAQDDDILIEADDLPEISDESLVKSFSVEGSWAEGVLGYDFDGLDFDEEDEIQDGEPSNLTTREVLQR